MVNTSYPPTEQKEAKIVAGTFPCCRGTGSQPDWADKQSSDWSFTSQLLTISGESQVVLG